MRINGSGKYMAIFNAVLCVFCICMTCIVLIREFSPSGGGGWRVQAHLTVKSSDSVFGYFCCFLVLTFNLFNSFTEGTNPRVGWFIFWKTIIFQGSRGRPTFYRVGEGSNFFPGGGGRLNANFCRNLKKL